MERPHLMPYRGIPTIPSPKLLPHHVRKDNVITYKGNYYSVPTGTYQGHRTQVYLEEKEEMLYIYSLETGKNIAAHKICKDKGQLISNTSHRRDREAALDDYEATVRKRLPGNTVIDTYLSELRIHKNRNYRDNLQFILLRYPFYTEPTLIEAFTKCLEVKVFNGCSLMKVAESIRVHKGEALVEVPVETEPVPSSDTSSMVPDKTDISTFNTFFI